MPRSRSGSPRGKRRERSRSGERHKERRDKERDGGRERGRDKDAHESRHVEKKKDKIKSICGYTNDDNPFGDSELTKKFVWKKKEQTASHSSKGEQKSEGARKVEAESRIVELKRRREEREAERAMIEDMRWQARRAPASLCSRTNKPSHFAANRHALHPNSHTLRRPSALRRAASTISTAKRTTFPSRNRACAASFGCKPAAPNTWTYLRTTLRATRLL